MPMKIKLDETEYEIKDANFEIEAQVENNTIELVEGEPQYKQGIGHAKIVRVQLYLLAIGEDRKITEDKVRGMNPEHAAVLLNVIDGLPKHIAEAKYNNLQRLKAKQIAKEEKELEAINKKLAEEDETEQSNTEKQGE
jgi:hypothetical protein